MEKQRKCSGRSSAGARSLRGSSVAEAAAALVVLIGLAVGCMLFVVNIGVYSYYRQKVGSVANQAALRASQELSWYNSYNVGARHPQQLNAQIRAFANRVLSKSKLPGASKVVVTFDEKLVKVTITLDGLPLIGPGTVIPNRISVTDTSVCVLEDAQPPALATLYVNNLGVTVPAYGRFVAGITGTTPRPGTVVPPGTAVFRNFSKPYSQFSTAMKGATYSQKLITSNQLTPY